MPYNAVHYDQYSKKKIWEAGRKEIKLSLCREDAIDLSIEKNQSSLKTKWVEFPNSK